MSGELVSESKILSIGRFRESAHAADNEAKFPVTAIQSVSSELIRALVISGASNGHAVSPQEEAQIYYHCTKYCANIRNYFLVSVGMVAATVLKFGLAEQSDEIITSLTSLNRPALSLAITEPSVGSDMRAVQTTYQTTSDGYVVCGVKKWITLGGIADKLLVVATGENGLGVFIVPAGAVGVSRLEQQGLMCSRGSHLAEVKFNNVLVPKTSLLGGDFEVSRSALSFALNNGRAISAISGVSLASAALEELVNYSRKRRQFGSRLCEHQLVQEMIGQSTTAIYAAKAIAVDAFTALRTDADNAKQLCAAAKWFSSTTAKKVTSTAMQGVGAVAISADMPLSRYYREATAFDYIEGTPQVLAQLVARERLVGFTSYWGG